MAAEPLSMVAGNFSDRVADESLVFALRASQGVCANAETEWTGCKVIDADQQRYCTNLAKLCLALEQKLSDDDDDDDFSISRLLKQARQVENTYNIKKL